MANGAGHTPGPWFWNYEGCWVLKRQLVDEDGNHAGYELLGGDYSQLAQEHQAMAEAVDALRTLLRLDTMKYRCAVDTARAALSKAEGK